MRDINEVLALQDINQKIYYLKKGRKTKLPDAVKLYNDWNPNRHEIITDEEKYPKIKVTLKPEKKYTDPTTGKEYTEPEQKKRIGSSFFCAGQDTRETLQRRIPAYRRCSALCAEQALHRLAVRR